MSAWWVLIRLFCVGPMDVTGLCRTGDCETGFCRTGVSPNGLCGTGGCQ